MYSPASAKHKTEALNHPVGKRWALSLINAEKGIKYLSEFISWRCRYAITLNKYVAGTGWNTMLPVVSRV